MNDVLPRFFREDPFPLQLYIKSYTVVSFENPFEPQKYNYESVTYRASA